MPLAALPETAARCIEAVNLGNSWIQGIGVDAEFENYGDFFENRPSVLKI
jgi:hypothetical protein